MSFASTEWSQWAERFAALSRRERLTVGGGAILVVGMLIFNLAIDPQLGRIRVSDRALAAAQAELEQQRGLVSDLKRQESDPNSTNRDRLALAMKDLAATNERLATMEAGMVPPDHMRSFLEGLLATHRGVELLGIKTIPAELVGAQISSAKRDQSGARLGNSQGDPAAGPQAKSTEPEKVPTGLATVGGIYQHGIELRLAGSYNDLLGYLTALERMPKQLLWSSASLVVEQYPRSVLVLRLYTLSLERNWLTL